MSHYASDDALGPAPKPGQVEQCASWRAAWRALGRPEADRAEAEMSNGQLRVRVRAHEREKAWAPPYVGEELAGTRQSAERERRIAALRTAEAGASENETTREQLRTEAEQATALAAALDARAAELQIADDARAVWLAHTAETRASGERAEAELETRGIDNTDDGPTPEEWLHIDASEAAEDQHREVTAEHELADVAQQRDADTIETRRQPESVDAELADDKRASKRGEPEVTGVEISGGEIVADHNKSGQQPRSTESIGLEPDQKAAEERAARERQAPTDIREVTAGEERLPESDTPRVPTADETAEAVRRAQRALIEIQHRREAEERHAVADADARDEELARWHADDNTTGHARTAVVDPPVQATEDTGPVMELGHNDD